MTPTTILIEREADAKVFEVLRDQHKEVKWDGEKSGQAYPYYIVINNNLLSWRRKINGTPDFTATDWLAQHGYVWDGKQYRENIAASVYPADRNYVAPVSAPTRTEQREKELTDDGWNKVIGLKQWEKDGCSPIHNVIVNYADDDHWNDVLAHRASELTQPAPYTAGQEVEYGEDKVECATFDHEYNGIAYLKKLPHTNQLIAVPIDHIRPVQVQPEMPEQTNWEKIILRVKAKLGATHPNHSYNWITIFDALHSVLITEPLITPKQVTDDEIQQKWVELLGSSNWPHFDIVRWALQKAEGGKGMKLFVEGVWLELTPEQIKLIEKEKLERKKRGNSFTKVLKRYGFKSNRQVKGGYAHPETYWWAEYSDRYGGELWLVGKDLPCTGFPGGMIYWDPAEVEKVLLKALNSLTIRD